MTFRREVIGQFHCKLLLSSEIAKEEVIVVEPIKREIVSLYRFESISNKGFNGEKLI